MKYALLMVLFFADGVENPRPQFLEGMYPMIIEAENCDERMEKYGEQLAEIQEETRNKGQTFPDYRLTCEPIAAYTE